MKPQQEESPEQNHRDKLISAAYDHVESMIPQADDSHRLMWHGWALREAFMAGAEWQKENP